MPTYLHNIKLSFIIVKLTILSTLTRRVDADRLVKKLPNQPTSYSCRLPRLLQKGSG